MPIIRKARYSDAKQLSQLAETTFRATFSAMNTAEDLDLHCQSSYSEAIQASEISDPSQMTLLSEDAGRLIGFAQLRWGNAPACVSGKYPGEIQRLYVVNDWHGKGVAQALMNACIEAIKQHGSDVIWLGVWERNPRAISFYQKCGFVEVGDHIFPVGNDPQRDLILVRSVAG